MSFFEELNGLSIQDKVDKLNKIKYEAERELIEARKDLQENYIYCEKCGRYCPKENLQTVSDTEIILGECVYTDAGYGDDDMFADVTYLVTSYVCPNCGNKVKEKGRISLSTSNRRDRWGNRF